MHLCAALSRQQVFDVLDLTDTPFTRQLCNAVVFDIADSDQNNTLTFDEFMLGVAVVCTLTRDQLLYFVFRCFDLDDSGHLSHNEFVAMSEAINEAGGGFFDGNFSQLLDKFDSNNDGNVDFGEFLLVDTYFPMAFYPVFRMQVKGPPPALLLLLLLLLPAGGPRAARRGLEASLPFPPARACRTRCGPRPSARTRGSGPSRSTTPGRSGGARSGTCARPWCRPGPSWSA